MNIYRLTGESRFINPMWLSKITGKSFDVEVDSDGKVTIEGEPHRDEDDPIRIKAKRTIQRTIEKLRNNRLEV